MSWLLGEGYDIRNGVKLVSKREEKGNEAAYQKNKETK